MIIVKGKIIFSPLTAPAPFMHYFLAFLTWLNTPAFQPGCGPHNCFCPVKRNTLIRPTSAYRNYRLFLAFAPNTVKHTYRSFKELSLLHLTITHAA
jgi:hypothetical protein